MGEELNHGGESRDFKTKQWRKPLKKNVDSGKTFFDISINTGQIHMGFEAETLENDSDRHMDEDLVKKLLTSNRKIRLLVNNFLTKYLSVSRKRWTCSFHYSEVSASNLMLI